MPKVALVEDDPTMFSLLQMLLQMEGFQVLDLNCCPTLNEMIGTLKQERPDLVLLDIHLRQIDGFDLLRAIRQDAELKATRVLMSSGMDMGVQSVQEGADGFILKPYMPEELIQTIQQTLGV